MSRMNEPSNPQGPTEQMREKAQQMGESLREMGGQVSEQARQQFENLRQQAGEYYEQGRQKAEQWQQNVEEYVQDQPVKSLLIAAGVGFLLGVIWKRS